MKILLIHDGRSVAFLTSVVLYRIHMRRGDIVKPFSGPNTTRHATDFWRTTVKTLPCDGMDRVILCCMTFDDLYPEDCVKELQNIEAKTGQAPMILSHRWPDGYVRTPYRVLIPPFDILEHYSTDIEPEERELLRLSLIVSRQAAPQFVSKEDFRFSEFLGTAIWKSQTLCWERLTLDLETTLRDLRSEFEREPAGLSELTQRPESQGDGYARFALPESAYGHCEKTIENLIRQNSLPDEFLGLGILNRPDSPRGYIKRLWTSKLLPSVEWLLEQYAEQFELPPAELWWGPQDAKSLLFSRAHLTAEDLQTFVPRLERFAEAVQGCHYGERSPSPGIAKLVHEAATRAMESLDLCHAYTASGSESLWFDPTRTRVLIDRGNKSGKSRTTMILRLNAGTPRAAGFLYGHSGYNISKLEHTLNGILVGIGGHPSIWLGSLEVPDRLRIDVHMPPEVVAQLSGALRDAPEIETVPLDHAVERGILATTSTIFKRLSSQDTRKNACLIVYRESETIGPSIQYALVAGALAEEIGVMKGSEVYVLDLFAGSGLVAREVFGKQRGWHVFCVDKSIRARQAGLMETPNAVWLKTDVREVFEDGLLDRQFDLVCMDPPHGAVFDLLYEVNSTGRTLVERVADNGPWLVLYQGHATQIGRGRALRATLLRYYSRVLIWRIGAEAITLAGPAECQVKHSGEVKTFEEISSGMRQRLVTACKPFGWSVEQA